MSRPTLNLQDHFLNQVRRENLEITIIMLDGSQLPGRVKGFDNFTVIIQGATGGEHLIYKHAIAQLVAAKQIVSAAPPRPPRAPGERGGERGERGDRPPRGDRPHGDRPHGGGGPRPRIHDEGADVGAGARSSRGGEHDAPAGEDADASAGGEGGGGRPRSGESGFNKLDLSALKGKVG